MDVWHVLFPRDVQCVHVFVARVTRLFSPTISEANFSRWTLRDVHMAMTDVMHIYVLMVMFITDK